MPKVLIVDDEFCSRLLLEQMLTSYDKELHINMAATGEEALNVISSENPDLVFLDLQIPIINGYKLCEIIKTNKKYGSMKIIVTTAMLPGVVKHADFVMSKPFSLKDISQVCDIYLKGNKADTGYRQNVDKDEKKCVRDSM